MSPLLGAEPAPPHIGRRPEPLASPRQPLPRRTCCSAVVGLRGACMTGVVQAALLATRAGATWGRDRGQVHYDSSGHLRPCQEGVHDTPSLDEYG